MQPARAPVRVFARCCCPPVWRGSGLGRALAAPFVIPRVRLLVAVAMPSPVGRIAVVLTVVFVRSGGVSIPSLLGPVPPGSVVPVPLRGHRSRSAGSAGGPREARPPNAVGRLPSPFQGVVGVIRSGAACVVGCEWSRSVDAVPGVSVGWCGCPKRPVSGARGPVWCPAPVLVASCVVGALPDVPRLPGSRAGPGPRPPGRCVSRLPSDAAAASVRTVCRCRYPRVAGTQIKIR